jgi:hypothetical protein
MNRRLYLICSLSAMLLNRFGNRLLKCGKSLGTDFQSVAKWWLHDKEMKTTNACTTTALWVIWKLRNELCFQNPVWSGVHILL